jgi:hypothetical protein
VPFSHTTQQRSPGPAQSHAKLHNVNNRQSRQGQKSKVVRKSYLAERDPTIRSTPIHGSLDLGEGFLLLCAKKKQKNTSFVFSSAQPKATGQEK